MKIYTITKVFPADEKFGLVNQMRRVAISVSSNIAEGCSRKTAKDQAYFYNMVYSSLIYLICIPFEIEKLIFNCPIKF